MGLLRCLVKNCPDLDLPIITGVSAGAINAAFLAGRPGSLPDAVETLTRLWSTLTVDQVFRVDAGSLLSHVVRWGLRLVSGGGLIAPRVQGLVDTTPLRLTLERNLAPSNTGEITTIAENLEAGRLRALAIITSSYSTGQSVAWVQGCDIQNWERPYRRSLKTRMTVEHIMASGALPLFFPAVQLGGAWYGDGGIRLTAPFSPALHLGARRILAVSTRYRRSIEEADQPQIHGYPPPLQISGQLLNAMFLDDHDRDALGLEHLNVLLRELPPDKRHGFSPVDHVVIRPSRDLGKLARDFEPRLPRFFRPPDPKLGLAGDGKSRPAKPSDVPARLSHAFDRDRGGRRRSASG